MRTRAIFLVDGFNIYHSVVDIARHFSGLSLKWLDIYSLCNSFLHLVDRNTTLECVYYFSALAYHLNDPGVIARHKSYIKCLQETGIKVQLGRFKPKTITCPHCGNRIIRHEEKETDVAIAARLFAVLHNDECDYVVLMTGDTDLTPAVRTAQILFPRKHIIFAFPYKRHNKELENLAPGSFRIHKNSYVRHQLPDPFPLSDGTQIQKPPSW